MEQPIPTRKPRAAAILIALYLAIAGLTFLDYGISWDEPLQAEYAAMVIDYYASGFEDRRYETFFNLAYYGPVFEVLPALVYERLPDWKYEIRHLFIVLAAAASFVAVMMIARKMSADPRLAAFAVLALMLMPRYYGHTFLNSKDIPFAAAFSWSIYALILLAERPGLRTTLVAGAVTGLTLGIRVGGVLVFVIAGASMLLHAWLERSGRAAAVGIVRRLAAAGVLAWIVMFLVWPWAHSRPIANPMEALGSSMSFQPPIPVRFAGETLTSADLPRHYLAHMLAIVTPLPVLALAAVGFVATLRRLLRRALPLAHIMVLAWAVIPPLIQVILGSPLYNGTRHFLFVYPAAALLAGTGAIVLTTIVGSRFATLGIAAALLSVVPAMVTLHPYQYVYYNEAVGGLRGAAADYDADYWAASYREAAHWINSHQCSGGTRVLIAGDRYSEPALAHFASPGVTTSTLRSHGREVLPEAFDYYVGVRRQEMDPHYAAEPVVHRIERAGTTLAVIRGGCDR